MRPRSARGRPYRGGSLDHAWCRAIPQLPIQLLPSHLTPPKHTAPTLMSSLQLGVGWLGESGIGESQLCDRRDEATMVLNDCVIRLPGEPPFRHIDEEMISAGSMSVSSGSLERHRPIADGHVRALECHVERPIDPLVLAGNRQIDHAHQLLVDPDDSRTLRIGHSRPRHPPGTSTLTHSSVHSTVGLPACSDR